MNKAEFITELNERLIVLTEEERQDILDEYEQHIDMKVSKGMTQEEAIADFGRISELSADILEAYHVRADFISEESGRRLAGKHRSGRRKGYGENAERDAQALNGEEDFAGEKGIYEKFEAFCMSALHGAENCCRRFWDGCKSVGRAVKRGIHRCETVLEKWAGCVAQACARLFCRRKETEEKSVRAVGMSLADEHGVNRGRERKAGKEFYVWRAMCGMCKAVWAACLWCMRWTWNLFCIGTGVLLGFGACIVLFCMGVLVVLLILGYPLVGVTIGWLGLTLCTVSATALCFTLVRIRKKSEKEEDMIHA